MVRKTSFLPRLYLPLLLVLCVLYSWHPLGGGYDFWAHAAVGRWIWNHGQVPRYSLFVWSAPHYPWVAHSWLSQLLFYGLISAGGPFLVMGLTVVFVCLTFGLTWRMWARRGPLSFVAPLLFALAMWCSSPRFMPRQELLTALILVCLLAYLTGWREGRIGNEIEASHSRPFLEPASFGIVALFALWINLHALVVLGLVLMLATAGVDCLQYRCDRRSRALLAIALLCVGATLLNPFGINYWKAAEVLRAGSQASVVDEWKPFWRSPRLGMNFVYAEAALELVALLAWLLNARRRWAQLFWLLLIGVMFIMSRRHLWLLALTCLSVMAANAESFDMERWWPVWRRFTGQPILLGIPRRMRLGAQCFTLIVLGLTIRSAAHDAFGAGSELWPPRGVSAKAPVQVAAIIQQQHLPEHIFNDYEDSSYLQWSLNGVDPRTGEVPAAGLHPLFLDLLNAYPDNILVHDYFEILGATPAGKAMLDREKINTVYLGPDHSGEGLAKYLNNNRAWHRLLHNEEGLLWVRRVPLTGATAQGEAPHGEAPPVARRGP